MIITFKNSTVEKRNCVNSKFLHIIAMITKSVRNPENYEKRIIDDHSSFATMFLCKL